MHYKSDLNKFPSEIGTKNGIHLVLNKKMHCGRNNLSDIIWYQYKIMNSKELGIVYDNVCLCLCRITESVRIEASRNIIEKGVSKDETVRPHIDYLSGNIHPSKEYIANQCNGKIQQLVLCKGLGPHVSQKESEQNEQLAIDFYRYKNRPRQLGTNVHKACYYPLVDSNLNLQNNWRYKLLEEIWGLIN